MGLFRMPSLGADMDEGTLLEWLVSPGDTVHRGEVIAVIDTAKSAIDVEVFEDGTVAELLVEPGTRCEVGRPLARIEGVPAGGEQGVRVAPDVVPGGATPTRGASVSGGAARERKAARPTLTAGTTSHGSGEGHGPGQGAGPGEGAGFGEGHGSWEGAVPGEGQAAGARPGSTAHLTPPIRHLMHQFGLEPDQVRGSGPDGRITREDVLAAAGERSAGGPPVPASRPRVTPRARRIAARRGVDLSTVTGSGSGGAVTAADVRTPTAAPRPAAPTDRTAAMRAATAALMGRAAREIPHYYVVDTFDVTGALVWLRTTNAARRPRERILPAALFLRAAVVAAGAVPELNGHWTDHFEASPDVDLGVAVATRGGGLVTPRMMQAQDLSLDDLMVRLTDLVRRARAGRLKASELQPGSITVSSLADGGPEALFGVIYPPQVALVGIGAVAPRPVVVDGRPQARDTVTVTLAADHRATDGRTGARFLAAFGAALTRPEEL